jgi:hypothetical protein
MYYICIENNNVTSVLNYEPNVPSGIEIVNISDDVYQSIINETHYFDLVTKAVLPVPIETINKKQQDIANSLERAFLSNTDWQVMRHIRQKALNEPTSLTDEQYLELERLRQAAAARIV